jgi:predicted Zn-dependent protease
MGGFFYNLGRAVGPALRKGRWLYESVAGTEADALRAEYAVGRDLAQAFLAEMQADPDPAARQLVHDLGATLAGRIRNRQWRFQVTSVLGREVNAFALPGGFVFLTRPLLDLCGGDRDELAFVVGHEMGHVLHGHAMQRIMNGWALSAAGRALPVPGVAGGVLLHQVKGLLHLAYARDQELDADQTGVRLVHSAGLDPRAAIRLLRRLQQSPAGDVTLGGYFSTHPPVEMRVEALARYLREQENHGLHR